MEIKSYIQQIQIHLIKTHSSIFDWFEETEEVKNYRPVHKSFDWIRPEHMEPKGNKSALEIKEELLIQLNRCLNQLEKLKNGKGLLYKTTMTVNDLGKLNVYEYVYFLSKHAERHIGQMEENKKEFKAA